MNLTEFLDKIDETARAATQARWEYTGTNGCDYECEECGTEFPENGYAVKSKDQYQVLECHLFGMERFAKPDGEHIARMDPPTTLALTAALRKCVEALEFYADKTLYRNRRSHPENASTDLQWDSGSKAKETLSSLSESFKEIKGSVKV